MSKQKRPPQHSRITEGGSKEPTKQAEVEQQAAVGNEAVQSQLLKSEVEAAGPGSVRAEAAPLVERAVGALQTFPRPQARVDRFVDILENSRLPDARKSVLIDKIVADQEAAMAIEQAVERLFGEAGEETRAEAITTLDGIRGGIDTASEPEGGNVAERAERMVLDIAAGRLGSEQGAIVQQFVREVAMILAWQIEEEEEEDMADPDVPELG